MNVRPAGLAALVLACAAAPAWSQKQVYRCEQGGRVTYVDSPCKAGVAVDAADPRTAAERRTAQDIVKREQRLGERLARERKAAEAEAARRGPAHIRHAAAEQAASAAASGDSQRKADRKPAKPIKKTAPPAKGAPLQP